MKEVIGYCCAALIGISLGLIGGGGSILTVPVLVYLFGISPVLATSYSLCIVGVTSLAGAYHNIKKGFVDFSTMLLFAIPSVIIVLIMRKLVMPRVPEHLFYIGKINFTSSLSIMLLFSMLIIIAAVSMIAEKKVEPSNISYHKLKFIFFGILIGLVTGVLGAGGGFLIIPILVLFVNLPMKKAVGTSLMIIAINSIFGFLVDVAHYTLNWRLLLTILAIAIVGVIAGGVIAKKIQGEKLRKGFGWFVLVIGIFILVKEISSL